MRKRISFTTYANTSIEVDVPDGIVARGAEAIAEYMQENGDFPWLCAQCASDRYGDRNLDLGDEWEPVRDEDGAIEVEDA